MINFRVIRFKDICKGLLKISILIICIIVFTNVVNFTKKFNLNNFVDKRKKELEDKTFMDILKKNLDKKSIKGDIKKQNMIAQELGTTAIAFVPQNIAEEEQIISENPEPEMTDESNLPQEVPTSAETRVVAEHNLSNVYNSTYGSVKIRNQTAISLSEDMLVPDAQFDKSNIIIFHTHTSESYTPSDKYQYVASGNFRTLNTDCSVVGVGNELTNRLVNKGINVIHDTTFHDYPEYTGAYTRSMQTVQNILNNTNADLVIDLHRDAIGDSTYGPSVMIGDEKVAQIMFVMGSNEGVLSHPNWLTNLKIAIKIQEKANEMYPGLFRPILLTKYRYNEHLAKGSCILEVGATGNTMDECVGSMKYLAEVINSL